MSPLFLFFFSCFKQVISSNLQRLKSGSLKTGGGCPEISTGNVGATLLSLELDSRFCLVHKDVKSRQALQKSVIPTVLGLSP